MDPYIGGYISQTLSAKGAKQYIARLLRGHARSLRPTVSQKWSLDYDAASQAGTVVPQHISFSGTSTGARHLANVSLNMPIFFVHDDDTTLGLPLLTAVEGDREGLLGGRDTAPVGIGSTICLRINWPGYSEWNLRIKTRDQNATSNTISLEKFAKRVADGVGKFLDVARQELWGQDSDWRIGATGITKEDVILVGVIQVAHGIWTPILQLNRYVPR